MTTSVAPANPAKARAARHASLDDARAWLNRTISAQPLSLASGFVQVEDLHFHVARTRSGPVVSLVEWKSPLEGPKGYTASLNPFVIDLEARDRAAKAWNDRGLSEITAPSESRIDDSRTTAKSTARSGAR